MDINSKRIYTLGFNLSALLFFVVAGVYIVAGTLDHSPIEIYEKIADRNGLQHSKQRHLAHKMIGHVKSEHLRFFPVPSEAISADDLFRFYKQRQSEYAVKAIPENGGCVGGLLGAVSCWLTSGDTKYFDRAVTIIENFKMELPEASAILGNGWELALAYDYLSVSGMLSDDLRRQINSLLLHSLESHLKVLNEGSASLWHHRFSLASSAWICAIALDEGGDSGSLVAQAQAYFLDALNAIELTEAWPGGYNYWINSRAFIFSLAASAYINGLENAPNKPRVVDVLNRIGMWHVYATRPDNRTEGYADEGSRVDLADETRRVIDIIAQATRNSLFADYSKYLGFVHKRASYYRDYRWGFVLFNDPSLVSAPDQRTDLSFAGMQLPPSALFGKGSMNMAYLRSGWQSDATFVSYKASNIFSHHGHYDAGHFTLFKGAPLIVNSSHYSDFFSPNRLNYSIRTVAKNSILIMKPDETVRPNRFFNENVADGGQRIVMPTGSSITSVSDWLENIKYRKHYEGGQLISYEAEPGYVYIKSDLTGAYNTSEFDDAGGDGKAGRVLRELLYLRELDALLINDDISSVHAEYVKKVLFHTVYRPRSSAEERLMVGDVDNGISETSGKVFEVENKGSFLMLHSVFPEGTVARVIGGKDYSSYVEVDGDDSDLDGKNYSQGRNEKPWFENAEWRIEIQSRESQKRESFLSVLLPSTGVPRQDAVNKLSRGSDNVRVVSVGSDVVVFLDRFAHAPISFSVPEKIERLIVVGMPVLRAGEVKYQGGSLPIQSSASGIVFLSELDKSVRAGKVELSW